MIPAAFLVAVFTPPEPPRADEPLLKAYSSAKAAAYLDAVGVGWTRERKCVTCHTNMPYLLARPLLPGEVGWKEVRAVLEKDVAGWANKGKPRGKAAVVATAFALAGNDARTTGTLHPLTRATLDRMWADQLPTGEWNWPKCEWPPLEHDDYYGSVLAVLAAGMAPGGYAKTDAAAAGLAKLRGYFHRNAAPDLHHRAMLLWSSALVEGLMTAADQQKTIADLKAAQRSDGGWCLPALGRYVRRDDDLTPNDPASPSDGYASGLAVFVLRAAGVPVTDPAVAKGAAWIRANQRDSGRWFTRSLNTDDAHYISNAGTAFCILALHACGEKPDTGHPVPR